VGLGFRKDYMKKMGQGKGGERGGGGGGKGAAIRKWGEGRVGVRVVYKSARSFRRKRRGEGQGTWGETGGWAGKKGVVTTQSAKVKRVMKHTSVGLRASSSKDAGV